MNKDLKEDELLFVPLGVRQRFTIDVYLPKNLINHGLLIELLAKTVAFNGVKQYLLKNAPSVLRELGSLERDKENIRLFPINEVARSIPKSAEPHQLRTLLRAKLKQLKKKIDGYSIFEVDGAFEDSGRGRAVPLFRPTKHSIIANPNDPKAGSNEWWLNHLKAKYNFGRSEWSLKRDPSRPRDRFRRVLSHPDNSRRLLRVDSRNPDRLLDYDCIHLLEERTLVIRFLIDLGVRREGWEFLPMHGDDLRSQHLNAIWDALLVIGCYFVRELGRRGGIEDQIWISYDLGCLWKWQKGAPIKDSDTKRDRIPEGDTPIWPINQ